MYAQNRNAKVLWLYEMTRYETIIAFLRVLWNFHEVDYGMHDNCVLLCCFKWKIQYTNCSKERRDPISPFLFVAAMEYLSRLFNCEKVNPTNLGFADDLFLYCRVMWTQRMPCTGNIEFFSLSSGLIVEPQKILYIW